MSGRSPGSRGVHQGSRCLLILQRSLAIQLQKVGPGVTKPNPGTDVNHAPSEYWMYDSGYLLFQGFLEANLKCFWNASLLEAMKLLQFQGYVAPGVLLVSSSACALEVVRAAWARNVLKPPNNYVIALVGDIDDCLVQPLPQGQFTPLPEALCWVILDLTSSGEPAVLEKIRSTLGATFPSIQRPSTEVIYDALAKLSADRKVYQTSQGYFVVTPERRRRDSSRDQRRLSRVGQAMEEVAPGSVATESRQLLMSPEEAHTLVHGEMSTIRDGDVTHQSVQTNLADVICGGNPNDKILYARVPKRSSSFPASRLERRHSLRLFGSSKRLSSPSRAGSMRHIANKHFPTSDSSSSTEYPSTDSTSTASPKKSSLLSRLFRRSKRATSVPPIATFSAQFPPAEWFNQRVVHLHSVGTQTNAAADTSMAGSLGRSQVSFATWTDDEGGFTTRASTLPRRHHHRHDSGGGAASHTAADSTPRTARRHRSPSSLHSSTLPRSSHSKIDTHSLCTSRNSVLPNLTPHGSSFSPCKSSATTLSSHSSKNSTNRKASPIIGGSRENGGFERSTMRGSCRNSGVYSPTPSGVQVSPQLRRSVRSPHTGVPVVGNGIANGNGVYQNYPNGEYRNSTRMSNSPLKQNGIAASPGTNGLTASPGRTTGVPSRNGLRSSLGKSPTAFSQDNKTSGSPRNSQLISPSNKSSITLQVSTSNRNSPTNSSPSVIGETKSTSPMTSTTTTTTTINGSNTKIYVQQQNSPVRSLITFENQSHRGNKDFDEVLIVNEPEKPDKENCAAVNNVKECSTKRPRPKLERPTSLYSPREVMKSGFGYENKIQPEIVRRFPSVESLTCSDITITNSEDSKSNFSNQINNSHSRIDKVAPTLAPKSPPTGSHSVHNSPAHPNLQPSTHAGKTMNNTRKLSNSGNASSLTAGVGITNGLSYKNVFANPLENSFGSKHNVTSSPDKTFDSTGSFNNLFNANVVAENKLSTQNSHDFSSTKTLDELRDRGKADLCTFPSLSDLSVSFKSIAAQKILQGISINSIDTLVEVNMAAAEKQNNCDVTLHTDFGLV